MVKMSHDIPDIPVHGTRMEILQLLIFKVAIDQLTKTLIVCVAPLQQFFLILGSGHSTQQLKIYLLCNSAAITTGII